MFTIDSDSQYRSSDNDGLDKVWQFGREDSICAQDAKQVVKVVSSER